MSKSGRAFYDQQVKNEETYMSSPQGMMDQLEEKFTNIFSIKHQLYGSPPAQCH